MLHLLHLTLGSLAKLVVMINVSVSKVQSNIKLLSMKMHVRNSVMILAIVNQFHSFKVNNVGFTRNAIM